MHLIRVLLENGEKVRATDLAGAPEDPERRHARGFSLSRPS